MSEHVDDTPYSVDTTGDILEAAGRDGFFPPLGNDPSPWTVEELTPTGMFDHVTGVSLTPEEMLGE